MQLKTHSVDAEILILCGKPPRTEEVILKDYMGWQTSLRSAGSRLFVAKKFPSDVNWSDGEVQTRQWKINKIDEHNYEGTAGDVVGTAKGFSYGPAFKFEYVLLVPVKGKEIKITFDDWIFKQDERVAINRATMTKFGIKVAELTVMFVKD